MIPASSPADNSFFDEFLDDFFAECDEHLTVIRRDLLALEPFVGRVHVDRALLEELFRSFHSLKGLAGMVGVSDVERLAHQTESYFRALRDQRVVLQAQALDTLIVEVRMLEQALAAWRARQPGPDVDPVLAALTDLLPDEARPEAVPSSGAASLPDQGNGTAPPAPTLRQVWRFEFLPTPELADQGVNVNSVRTQLQEIGEIEHARPLVRPAGVAFEFIVATDADAESFSAWAAHGLRWEPYSVQVAAQPAAASTSAAPISVAPANVVRVDLTRLDELMHMIGELVITRSRLENRLAQIEPKIEVNEWRDLHDINVQLGRQLRDLREGVVRVRMVPMGDIFARMQFVVRDLAHELGRQVRLELHGQHTEVDKYIVERLADPLLHLVRNAVSHGLEPASERMAQGKPAEGTLMLSAFDTGDIVTIELADDGRGIDRHDVAERARALGLLDGDGLPDDAKLLDLLCLPGFSTREQVDRVSGRGVGMDVVQRTIYELGGTLTLTTEVGRGTRFTMQLPLTLTIMDALIVAAAGQTFAMPLPAVREAIQIAPDDITALENNELLRYREQVVPLVRLARVFRLPGAEDGAGYGLVIGQERHTFVLTIDRLLDKREIVVRPIADPLVQVVGIGGATELGDGRVVLILDPADLNRLDREGGARPAGPASFAADGRTSSTMHELPTTTQPYILFELAGTSYAIRSSDVQHIDMLEQVTPVPNAPTAIDGVVFVRGQLIPALNLRARFGLPKIPYDLRTRLLVIKHDRRQVGLVVDSAREFVQIDPDTFQPPPEAIGSLSGNYLDAIATLSDRLVLLLNLREVLTLAESLLPTSEAGSVRGTSEQGIKGTKKLDV
ncbi:MAG TPA: chemotaxis protein CheA [Herpetosiphonaceae bacterium]